MTCKGILKSLSGYLDGEIAKNVCREIEEHLRGCERCRMYVDSIKLILRLFKDWRDESLPQDLEIRLHKRLSSESRTRRKQ